MTVTSAAGPRFGVRAPAMSVQLGLSQDEQTALVRQGARVSRHDQLVLVHWPDALVVVEGTRIVDLLDGGREAHRADFPVSHFADSLLVPGFVDAHLHFPQTRVIGSASGPLLPWLAQTVFPEEARFSDVAYARQVAHAFVDAAVRVGTTTMFAYSSSSIAATQVLFEVLAERGIRGRAGLTLMDQDCPEALRVTAAEAIRGMTSLAKAWSGHDNGRLDVVVTPRFVLSCSDALMRSAAEFALAHGLWVQTHVAENRDECAAVMARYPQARSYLDVYQQLGLLHERTLLAHAVHFDHSDWRLCAERGARVAHCPDSNFFLGSGCMRWASAHEAGVPLALGSDIAAGRSFDMRRVASSAFDASLLSGHRLNPVDLFATMTLMGAHAIGLGGETGSLEVGKHADMVLLGRSRFPHSEPPLLPEGLVASLIFGSDQWPVTRVWAGGRPLSVLQSPTQAVGMMGGNAALSQAGTGRFGGAC
jgi:guanine deaminase